jgi:DNA-directed RNA polymerase specialized sigma24 family protein
MEQWINQNYPKLVKAAQNICKCAEWEDVLSYSLEVFLTHPKREQIVKDGGAMWWIVRTMMNSFNSTTSAYHRFYRETCNYYNVADFVIPDVTGESEELEATIQQIEALIDLGLESKDPATWYRVKLLKLYVDTPNYSELARKTGISRTSISQAVQEAIQWVKDNLQLD